VFNTFSPNYFAFAIAAYYKLFILSLNVFVSL